MATSQLVSATQVIDYVTVPPSSTVNVDSFSTTNTRSVKWILTAGTPDLIYQTSEILALQDGVDVMHTEYAIIGGPINYTADVVVIDGSMVVQVTNNTTKLLTVSGISIETRI